MSDGPGFTYEDDPAEPGWKRWQFRDATRYNAVLEPIWVRVEDGAAVVRMVPRHEHSNMRDVVHGGALLGFMDVALFAGSRGLGVLTAGGASTIDLSAQFVDGAQVGTALDARVELLRETGRLLFLRGLVTQEGRVIASFAGTVRKPSTTK